METAQLAVVYTGVYFAPPVHVHLVVGLQPNSTCWLQMMLQGEPYLLVGATLTLNLGMLALEWCTGAVQTPIFKPLNRRGIPNFSVFLSVGSYRCSGLRR